MDVCSVEEFYVIRFEILDPQNDASPSDIILALLNSPAVGVSWITPSSCCYSQYRLKSFSDKQFLASVVARW